MIIYAYENELQLFSKPVLVNWREEVNPELQLELMELQYDQDIKIAFDRTLLKKKEDRLSLVEFYQKYVHAAGCYPKLSDQAKRIASFFGSTYVCEQLFSKMKFIKNKYRTNLTPNIEKIVMKKQHHVSH